MNQTLFIIFGFIIAYVVSFLIAWTFLYIYDSFTHKGKYDSADVLPMAAWLGLFSLVVTFVSVIVFSNNITLFVVISFLLLMTGNYIILGKLYKIKKRDAIILAIGLSLVQNPGWLYLLGII